MACQYLYWKSPDPPHNIPSRDGGGVRLTLGSRKVSGTTARRMLSEIELRKMRREACGSRKSWSYRRGLAVLARNSGRR